ncbi:hypothetical protein [Streptomyces sp. WG7]|uniref:hypothetical protein n=1 Tax=Streptomyces sp. WG7 TaxID=3417650 RepID=UPI003CF949D1
MRAHRTAPGVVAALFCAALAVAGPATALPPSDEPDHGVTLQGEGYLTTDVGGTLTLRPEVFTVRSDGSRSPVPKGAPVGPGRAIEYALPWNTSPVRLDEQPSCRKVDQNTDSRLHIRCDRVVPLTFRVDKAFIAHLGMVSLFPEAERDGSDRWENDRAGFAVTAPVPHEEGETPASRERREATGAVLLGVAGALALLALLLARTRSHRAVWVACTVLALLCAAPGVWSITRGPLVGAKTYTRYPSARPALDLSRNMQDNFWLATRERPERIPPIATAPDPGNEEVTEVSGYYEPVPPEDYPTTGWIAAHGAYGRIEDPRRARDHMLRTAAGAPGVKVTGEPRLILLRDASDRKTPVLFTCQVLVVRDQDVTVCAWADKGVRALVARPGTSPWETADHALGVRLYAQLGEGF